MTAKLRFENRNRSGDVIEIYRTDVETTRPDVANRIATLAGDSTVYLDTTAVVGNTYFYVVVAMEKDKPETRLYNFPFKLKVTADRGPGSQTLQLGDARFGFFGTVPIEQLPSISIGPYVDSPANRRHTGFLKLIRNNKILYAPNGPLSAVMAPDQAANSNAYKLRSGTPVHKRSSVANPLLYGDNIVTIDGYRFHLRLMYGAPDDWSPDQGTPNKGSIAKNSELYDILSLMSSTILDTRLPVIHTYIGTTVSAPPAMLMSEVWGTSVSGQSAAVGIYAAPTAVNIDWTSRIITVVNTNAIGMINSGNGYMLYPILELIEE